MELEIGRGKKARRAYGFDDIAIVPSRRTRDPDDVDISWKLGPYRFDLPLLASAMDGVVSPTTATHHRQARRPRRPEPRGHLLPLRGRRRAARAHRGAAQGPRDARDAGDLPAADRARADARSASARSRSSGVVTAASLTPQRVAQALRDGARRRARHPRDPGHRRLGRARLEDERAAEPQGVHRRAPGPGRRRRLCQLPHGSSPDAHRRGRRARRRRSGRGVHDARRARPRRPAGDGDRRCRRRALARTCSRPASTCRSSPTAACAPAATSPRRSPAAPTP